MLAKNLFPIGPQLEILANSSTSQGKYFNQILLYPFFK